LTSLSGNGANTNTQIHNLDGRSALEAAFVAQNWDIVYFLVGKGVNVDVVFTSMLNIDLLAWEYLPTLTSWGSDGSSALEAATVALKWNVIRLLVDKGANSSTGFISMLFLNLAVAATTNAVLTSLRCQCNS
jgi:ankyrin repeat protein